MVRSYPNRLDRVVCTLLIQRVPRCIDEGQPGTSGGCALLSFASRFDSPFDVLPQKLGSLQKWLVAFDVAARTVKE